MPQLFHYYRLLAAYYVHLLGMYTKRVNSAQHTRIRDPLPLMSYYHRNSFDA